MRRTKNARSEEKTVKKKDKNFQKSAIYLDLIKKNDYNQNRRNADREGSVSKNRLEESDANA